MDCEGVTPSEGLNRQIVRTIQQTLRRGQLPVQTRNRWHKKGGSGGGAWIEGVIEDNSCPNGTLDINVDGKGAGATPAFGDVVRCVDRFEWMQGHTAAELAGELGLAAYTETASGWVWRVWSITGFGECEVG